MITDCRVITVLVIGVHLSDSPRMGLKIVRSRDRRPSEPLPLILGFYWDRGLFRFRIHPRP